MFHETSVDISCCVSNTIMYACCVSVTATLQKRLKEMRPSEAEVNRLLLRYLGLMATRSLRTVR